MTADLIYTLCALTSALCAWLLTRGYQRTRERLLLWSSACFGFFAISNILLMIDLTILPAAIDLSNVRTVPSLIGASLMLYGLIWESR